MRRHVLLGLVIALAVVVGFALAAENSEEASPPAGCGGGGKVFFRCGGCKAAFEKEPEKFTTKANLQLVLTGQVVQKGCPLSGRKCNPETEISVSGATVAFCCNGCQGKVAKAEGEKQLELVFSADPFKKAFEIKKEPAEEK